MSNRRERQILKLLLDFANDGSTGFPVGTIPDADGEPLLDIRRNDFVEWSEDAEDNAPSAGVPAGRRTTIRRATAVGASGQSARENARRLLKELAIDDSFATDNLEAEINARGGVRFTLVSWSGGPAGRTLTQKGKVLRGDPGGPARLVLTNTSDEALPYEILALARATPTGNGDSLADRIAHCAQCEKFFLLKTRKPSRYCSTACRWKFANDEKKQAGYFKRRRERQGRKSKATKRHQRGKAKLK